MDEGATWELVGLISLLDPPRPDSAETIQLARSLGVEVSALHGGLGGGWSGVGGSTCSA